MLSLVQLHNLFAMQLPKIEVLNVLLPYAAAHLSVVAKLRDADVMLNAGKDVAAVLQSPEICEATYQRWPSDSKNLKSRTRG